MPSLRTPASRALDLLRRAAAISPYFQIAASGGKDSNAIFALVEDLRKEDPRVRVSACFWYMVKGIDCVERPIKILCRRLGDCPLYFVPHFALPDHLYLGESRPRSIDTKRRAVALKQVQSEDAGRLYFAAKLSGLPDGVVQSTAAKVIEDTDEDGVRSKVRIDGLKVDPWNDIWVLGGQRSRDSLERRAMLSSFRLQASDGVASGGRVGLNVKDRRVYPVHDWSADEVLAYCRAKKLPPAAPIGGKNGSNLEPRDALAVAALKKLYPRDYEKFIAVFPNAAGAD